MSRILRRILLGFCCLAAWPAWAEEPTVVTLWPLFDYRHAAELDYTSVNLFGPLVKFERTAHTTRFGLRPLFFQEHGRNASDASGEILYPVAGWNKTSDSSHLQILHWLEWSSHPHDAGAVTRERAVTAFPFFFYQTALNGRGSLALFPVAGRLEGMYGRDRIDFFLFPLYARTERDGTSVTNLLWPVLARVRGSGGESGWKFWPLAGWADHPGVYRKRFFLWPLWTSNDLALDSPDPMSQRSVFPFWSREQSPDLRRTSLFWPFFNHTADARRGYEEWEFPWPLLRLTRGEQVHGLRLLPFYADETRGAIRKRWLLWPGYSREARATEAWRYRRDRLFYFLYSDTREYDGAHERPRLRRVDFWPLFHYEWQDGIGHFSTVALLEPFFPGNERIARNWAPLWRLYQVRWDANGGETSSLLWNLYWKDRRAEGVVWELFPVLRYRRHGDSLLDISVVKGLVRYRNDPEGRRLQLFFLPWGIPLGGEPKSE